MLPMSGVAEYSMRGALAPLSLLGMSNWVGILGAGTTDASQ